MNIYVFLVPTISNVRSKKKSARGFDKHSSKVEWLRISLFRETELKPDLSHQYQWISLWQIANWISYVIIIKPEMCTLCRSQNLAALLCIIKFNVVYIVKYTRVEYGTRDNTLCSWISLRVLMSRGVFNCCHYPFPIWYIKWLLEFPLWAFDERIFCSFFDHDYDQSPKDGYEEWKCTTLISSCFFSPNNMKWLCSRQ